jgi:hypothetical protein
VRSMTHHPKLHERITTVAGLFPGSKAQALTMDTGTTMVEVSHGPTHSSALLDDEGRRALIVALGGIPVDAADRMLHEVSAEDREELERLREAMDGLREAIQVAIERLHGEEPLVSSSIATWLSGALDTHSCPG